MFYILVDNQNVINQPFSSIQEARAYMNHHKIIGEIIDDYTLQELRQQPDTRPHSFSNSVIKKPYIGSNPRGRVPVCRPATTGHNVRQYQPIRNTPFKPKFVRRKK